MRLILASLAVSLAVTSLHDQADEGPHLVALFSNVEQAPAFMLYCPNNSPVPVQAIQLLEGLALRVDGVLQERTGGVRASFAGGEPFLDPGQTGRIMVGLRHAPLKGTKGPDFVATLRVPWMVPLDAGFHAVAMRCVDQWSNELAFYWEPAIDQRE
jgi:hypothetical protein